MKFMDFSSNTIYIHILYTFHYINMLFTSILHFYFPITFLDPQELCEAEKPG